MFILFAGLQCLGQVRSSVRNLCDSEPDSLHQARQNKTEQDREVCHIHTLDGDVVSLSVSL